jgi:hypothetical protein
MDVSRTWRYGLGLQAENAAPMQCLAAPGVGITSSPRPARCLLQNCLNFLPSVLRLTSAVSLAPHTPQGPLIQLFSATTCEGTEIKV